MQDQDIEFPGFTGPAYRLDTPNSACDICRNLYPETIEKGPLAGKIRLKSIPGLKDFGTLPTGPVRALWPGDNRLFAVGGSKVYEVFNDGTPPLLYGDVGAATNPAIIVSNGFQLCVASGGNAYLVNDSPPSVTPIVFTGGSDPVTAGTVAFLDNYFIAALANTKQVAISNLAPDGNLWDPTDVAIKEGYSDNIARVLADNEQLWLFGFETIEVWTNTGALFPFERIQGAVLRIGCTAPWSVAAVGGVRFWLWEGAVYSAEGLTPQRISDFGVEQAILGYSNPENAEAFAYIDGGHIFYVLSFPEAGRTWVYDAALKMWHERLYYSDGNYSRYRPRVYAKVWNKHIVGDFQTGNLYEMDPKTYTDAGGVNIRRQRTVPYFTERMTSVRFNRLTVDMDTGIGLDVAPGEPGYDPQVYMTYSDDRGKTYGNGLQTSAGKNGETDRRVIFKQLGSSRIGKTFDLVLTDPVPWTINGAYLDMNVGLPRP